MVTAGVVLLTAAVAVLVAGGIVVAPSALRLRRAAVRLKVGIESAQSEFEGDSASIRAGVAENERLMVPIRRIGGWLQHPLVVAALSRRGKGRRS